MVDALGSSKLMTAVETMELTAFHRRHISMLSKNY